MHPRNLCVVSTGNFHYATLFSCSKIFSFIDDRALEIIILSFIMHGLSRQSRQVAFLVHLTILQPTIAVLISTKYSFQVTK